MRKLSARRSAAVASVLSFFAACGHRELRPEPLPLDRVNCARCNMIVSQLRFAAQARSAGEETRFYDDVGCLAADAKAGRSGTDLFVVVDDAGRWTPASSAFYARPARLDTPMGYGFVALDSAEETRRRDRDGRSRAWAEVLAAIAAESPR
jgi:hypothetical protein